MMTRFSSRGKIIVILFVAVLASGLAGFSDVVAASPQISSLSPATQTRSGRLRIFGAGFGSDGQVVVDGLQAPVADWADTQIVAYVPEGSTLGSVAVQVVSAGGTSNAVTLQVTARQADGRVKWRFQHSGSYTVVRPTVSPDGTIYTVDVAGRLYALAPDGALKWIVRGAGNKGVTVGLDGTVYTGSEDTIKAFNSDGTAKWTFVQNPRAFIFLGPNVGPDANLYGVATQGMGVLSLTPDGNVRWTDTELYSRLIVDYQEVVFGPNGSDQQLYFLANNHLRGLRLDGSSVFSITTDGNQPAVGPDGTVYATYAALGAYTPSGAVKWSFFGVINNTATAPDVGTDGVVYFVHNLSTLYAVNPNGTEHWHVVVTDILQDPIVDPVNVMVAMGGKPNYGLSGFFEAFDRASHAVLWRVNLADENGGQLVPDSRPRFSADGQTMYITAEILGGDAANVYGYVYTVDAAIGGTPPTPTPVPTLTPTPNPSGCTSNCLRSTNIALSARGTSPVRVTGRVTVKGESSAAISGATVAATWTLPNNTTQNQSAVTNSRGIAVFTTSDGLGTYTLTVTNIAKTGYTFDPGNSVLSNSITR